MAGKERLRIIWIQVNVKENRYGILLPTNQNS